MDVDISIVMPCLNEAETLGACLRKAHSGMESSGWQVEYIVADNGSDDGSVQVATTGGARVVHADQRGYGHALQKGICAARGRWVVIGDADDSYDFADLGPMLRALEGGAELVMGNRFAGGIQPGAMPWLHRHVGNPVLSFLGRSLFDVGVRDFHCGLRAFQREAIQRLHLSSPGMEYATEMIVKSAQHGLRISEVPVILYPDGRTRKPHLRTWSDGWRHLKLMGSLKWGAKAGA